MADPLSIIFAPDAAAAVAASADIHAGSLPDSWGLRTFLLAVAGRFAAAGDGPVTVESTAANWRRLHAYLGDVGACGGCGKARAAIGDALGIERALLPGDVTAPKREAKR